jgi:hypothetical protein
VRASSISSDGDLFAGVQIGELDVVDARRDGAKLRHRSTELAHHPSVPAGASLAQE